MNEPYARTSPMTSSATKPLYRGTQIIWYAFYAIETFLMFRFLLKLIGANASAGFTQFVYGVSGIFMTPFRYVLPTPQVAGSVFEWSTLLAMLVYWVLAWGLVRLIVMGKPVSQYEAHTKLEQQDVE